MKIILASSIVPFVNGGGRFIVEWLEGQLLEHGHQVERFYLPFVDHPKEVVEQIAAVRLIDLGDACDRLITFRPPMHVLPHPHKILWFIHHIRSFYDLWGTPYAPTPTLADDAVRRAVVQIDNVALNEAQAVFTNSKVVSERLRKYNGVPSRVLYPPIYRPERFRCDSYGEEILAVCRVEAHKQQHLLIEAMAHVKTQVRLRICGLSSSPQYARGLAARITELGVQDRVVFEHRWISETEKADLLANALAVAYLPEDEDSYGYPSLEAAHSHKSVLTTLASGGVLELVEDGINGFAPEASPNALAERMDQLYRDRDLARRMGEANNARLVELNINWSHVVQSLTGQA